MVRIMNKRRWFKLSDYLWFDRSTGKTYDGHLLKETETTIMLFSHAYGIFTINKDDLVDTKTETEEPPGYT